MKRAALIAAAALLLAAGGSEAQSGLRAVVYATGFSLPVAVVQDPTDRNVQFVLEKSGRIRTVRAGDVLATDFLDLRAIVSTMSERGLLGLAFPPDAASSGRFFLNFTNEIGDTVVARFRRSADPLAADPSSRFDLRIGGAAFIRQPYANHNGGHLAFGPDGYLYVGLGDGGSANDPAHRAQNPAELLGKMLRIDVNVPDSDPAGYRIPPDNPFLSAGPTGTRQEIWAFGLRNPWRYSFDEPSRGGTGALIIGDVGQGLFEEIDYEPAGRGGRNYGWRNREGAHDHIASPPPAFLPLTDPVLEYGRSDGQSVSGGYVYRGTALGGGFTGRYFFGDFSSGRVWSVALTIGAGGEAQASDRRDHTDALGGAGALGNVSSFGVDADGELFLVSYSGGRVLRLVGSGSPPAAPTGLRIIR